MPLSILPFLNSAPCLFLSDSYDSSVSPETRPPPASPLNPSMDPSFAPALDSSSSRSRRGRNNNSNQEPSDKGKERESTESSSSRAHDRDRERERKAERLLGLSFDSGSTADDDESESDAGILHKNLTSASSTLQGLLRKLGAGLDDLLPSSTASGSSSHQSGRLKKIWTGLRAEGEEGRQVEALTQLCEMLSIGTEESLESFSMDSFVSVLVWLLNHDSNADIMLLATRGVTPFVRCLCRLLALQSFIMVLFLASMQGY